MSDSTRNISIFGSSGSIGVQALEVVSKLNNSFKINYLTTNSRLDILESQINKFNPFGVVICDYTAFKLFKKDTSFSGEILFGTEGLIQAATDKKNDLIVSALVGFAGVEPTLAALETGTDIALANKETLVAAGKIITEAAKKNDAAILAIDSEHSAVLQSMVGEDKASIEKIILTASGGPFLNKPISEFPQITREQALKHPNWTMGSKITIDSATMMNKGFEIIEAFWLFDFALHQIEVLIHPESIVHSMVQYQDGSVKAQLGTADMRTPISYALNFPKRYKFDFPRLNLAEISKLTFFKPDYDKFKCLGLAFSALETGGTAPTILNASNEIAVKMFLDSKIKFTQIPEIIEKTLEKVVVKSNPSFGEIIDCDLESRLVAENFVRELK
ncbi:MAG: 1-deoxy-D-xylulose-5-phosphate reductoisomerase [Candidatus Kapabacteria bacterium]|nr:1-deoxy-D-xylulose-5-phosphate reductoisomerase [Candidatus Kapabacteria bacterium]